MDKLKQNAFWIGVGGMGVVLAVLLYFLVVDPLMKVADVQAEIDAKTDELQKAAKRKPEVAGRDYRDHLRKQRDQVKDARDRGIEVYDGLGRDFDRFFDEQDTPPGLSEFAARYKDDVDKLVKAYRDKHAIKPPEENPESMPPKVGLMLDGLVEEKIPQAMKELWVIQAVFQAVDKLNLGGLKEIEFPGRNVPEKEVPEYNRWVDPTVKIELPFSQIENLLTELYSAPRVLFQLEELTCHKVPESVAPFVKIDRPEKVKAGTDPSKVRYEDVVLEPPVVCDLKLRVFDWTGVPEEKLKEKKEADETDDEGKKKKPKKKPEKKPEKNK
ncbi:MAG: hypothetical protein HY721_08070 [Planctomycetes bacterium]|nr:hypothetical protein [Planctomycetota bacterium]